jgi:hypothetical protein
VFRVFYQRDEDDANFRPKGRRDLLIDPSLKELICLCSRFFFFSKRLKVSAIQQQVQRQPVLKHESDMSHVATRKNTTFFPCHVMPYGVMSCHVIGFHVVPCHVMSCRVARLDNEKSHDTSRDMLKCDFFLVSCRVMRHDFFKDKLTLTIPDSR